ncbi:hypothetical protein JCM10908_005498 [Rhodotorula pacifica]|uniref:uncharacterized protein n=1 Tax=Rhodotorula pacifica TaxID=1495444 RepID=UPI00316DD61A
MAQDPSPPRNHRRTNSPKQIQLPPTMPPRPVMLATPSQGYPFPVMPSQPGTPREAFPPSSSQHKKVSVQVPTPSQQQHRRKKVAPEGDGWDTPLSSAPSSRTQTPAGDSRPNGMTRMSSTFSSSSSEATPSSSSCETPDDSSSSDPDDGAENDDDCDEEQERNDYREKAARKAASRLRKQLASSRPTTPAEMVYARTKHAGVTPGAPPPAPFYHPDFDHPSDTLLDRQDVRIQDETYSPKPSPRREAKVNPLAAGLAGMSVSRP